MDSKRTKITYEQRDDSQEETCVQFWRGIGTYVDCELRLVIPRRDVRRYDQQACGLEQVSKAISQMEEVTQKTAASAEQSAAAGAELSAQSETLRTVVAHLKAMVSATAEDDAMAVTARDPKATSQSENAKAASSLNREQRKLVTRVPCGNRGRTKEFPMEEEFPAS
jgi:hypothetical protein